MKSASCVRFFLNYALISPSIFGWFVFILGRDPYNQETLLWFIYVYLREEIDTGSSNFCSLSLIALWGVIKDGSWSHQVCSELLKWFHPKLTP